MANNKQLNSNEKKETKQEKPKNENQLKLFIQLLDVKKDTNMTRIYSAFSSYR